MNRNSLRLFFYLLTLLILVVFPLSSYAQSQSCPETKYERIHMNTPYTCKYKKGIELTNTWYGDQHCDYHMKYQSEQHPLIWDEEKSILLYSKTHPITVWVKLNRKEFKEENRDYWIQKGKEYLKIVESEYKSCPREEISEINVQNNIKNDGQNKDKKELSSENSPITQDKNQNESAPVSNKRKKTSWDDLEAPSAK